MGFGCGYYTGRGCGEVSELQREAGSEGKWGPRTKPPPSHSSHALQKIENAISIRHSINSNKKACSNTGTMHYSILNTKATLTYHLWPALCRLPHPHVPPARLEPNAQNALFICHEATGLHMNKTKKLKQIKTKTAVSQCSYKKNSNINTISNAISNNTNNSIDLQAAIYLAEKATLGTEGMYCSPRHPASWRRTTLNHTGAGTRHMRAYEAKGAPCWSTGREHENRS